MFLALGALALNHFVPRTQSVKFDSDGWEFVVAHDGLGSQASKGLTERGAETQVNLVDNRKNPFAAAVFRRGAKDPVDMTWFSQIKLRAYIVGKEQEYFRLFMRTQIPEFYDPSIEECRQYNEIAFKLTDQPQTYIFNKEHFHVPSWWVEQFGTKAEHSVPLFDLVDSVEINTGSSVRKATMTLVVEEIELRGHWISPIVLYRTLLSTWLLLALSVLIKRTLQMRKTIRQFRECESRLKLINSSLKSERNELEKLAHFDSLTGLLNRHGFKSDPRLTSEVLRQFGSVSVIVFDIDHFKNINDTQGHSFGDRVLADVGELLKRACGENQMIARWGGEEFLITCFEDDEMSACKFAESLRDLLEIKIGITCSFGVAEVGGDESFVDALDRADCAMYEAKTSGRNCVVSCSQMHLASRAADESSTAFDADRIAAASHNHVIAEDC